MRPGVLATLGLAYLLSVISVAFMALALIGVHCLLGHK